MRTTAIEQMKAHRDIAIKKAALMAVNPHCCECSCELRPQYGHQDSAILVGDSLKCYRCVNPPDWNQSCCSQCGADIPGGQFRSFCDECRASRRRQKESQRMAKVIDYRAEYGGNIYALPNGVTSAELLERVGIANCPLCGEEIGTDAIGCWKHQAILLMRAIRSSPAEV